MKTINKRLNETSTDLLEITYESVSSLKPYKKNPRSHTKKQIQQVAKSIEEFGFVSPILIDESKGIIAGHGRLEAAKLLGMNTVPSVLLSAMTEAQKRAYIIADNRLAEIAGWDEELLAIELQSLIDLDFEVELTGFETPQIDLIIANPGPVMIGDENTFDPPDPDFPPVTQLGDMWQLGRHTLFCGDATKADSYKQLLGNKKAQMVFTDPPYNVPINNHVCGKGKIQHREFAMASGEMSEAEFTQFLNKTVTLMCRHSQAGSLHFICMDWRHMRELLNATELVYSDLKNLCIWNKDNGGMGSLYRSKHELVFLFKNGEAPHINNVELGKHGRYRTNVWDYPGVNSFKTDLEESLVLHPTVKPIELVADAIMDCSKTRGLILDPFGGSGTTLLAAEKTNRTAALMELDPHYCDVIINRYQSMTQDHALHVGSKQTFEQIAFQHEKPIDSIGLELETGQ